MATLTSPHKQNTHIVQYCSRNQKATPAAVPKVPVQTTTTGNANLYRKLSAFLSKAIQAINSFFFFLAEMLQMHISCEGQQQLPLATACPPRPLPGTQLLAFIFFKATERSPLGCLKRQINSCSDTTSAVCSCHGCTPVTNEMLRKGPMIKSSGADSFRPRLIQYLSEDLWAYLSQGGISYFCSFMEN